MRPGYPEQASFIELSAKALRHNARVFRGIAAARPGQRLGAVIKGNAYGHGFEELLPLVHEAADVLYVIAAQDALRARERERAAQWPQREVLVLGAVGPRELAELARERVAVVLSDLSWLRFAAELRASRPPGPLEVHVHLDSGLGREGFSEAELPKVVELLKANADVFRPAGVLSHFANVEDVTEQGYALQQVATFERGAATLEAALGGVTLQRHMAASAASLVLPQARFDVLRVGIALYGLWPSAQTRLSARVVLGEAPVLEPVLAWRCQSQAVKWLEAGAYVGYGCTWRATERTRIAVLPMGYFDGYPRLASGKAYALVNGRRCPLLGRVMMNHLVLDVTGAARDADEVLATLIGADADEAISADTVAGWADTINYEVVSRLGPHLERRVV
ncbi:MAG: alanine racemase [Archangiaceae bacterium]|nr:alanine racemase [Archangiaceae bacterium]